MPSSFAAREVFAPFALLAALALPAAAEDAARQAWCEVTVGLEDGRPVVLRSVLVPVPSAGATDGDVFVRLGRSIVRLQADIDALRLSEASDPEPPPWQIAAAGPSHLYYAAQTLFWKVHRRAVRAAGTACLQSQAAVDDIATLDLVVNIVQRANEGLRRMLDTEGTAGAAAEGRAATDEPRARLAGELLAGLLAASRQLDTVLAIEYAPSDIYDRVEEALRQLGSLTEEPLPALPARRAEATSVADVYRRVFRCLRLSQVLEVKWNLETGRGGKFALSQWQGVDAAPNEPSLQINAAEGADSAAVDRAQAYELATLMVAHLASLGGGDGAHAAAYARPPSVTSSDVYRLAGALESQLLKMTGITLQVHPAARLAEPSIQPRPRASHEPRPTAVRPGY